MYKFILRSDFVDDWAPVDGTRCGALRSDDGGQLCWAGGGGGVGHSLFSSSSDCMIFLGL